MFWFTTPQPTAPADETVRPPACAPLAHTARPHTPLITELLALYCHTRPIGALAGQEQCAEDYRMIARSVIHHLFEGWQQQTHGRGTIDDLLITPRTPPDPPPTAPQHLWDRAVPR
ncbi:hypothetical protein ACFXPZ_17930 [Streptomyces sp. NPDC059101]|uniref:hypothetical protein n=1 Tax=Streptomyces sp. NPDC059101 TaxID=3346728 RepID=UPI0036847F38